MDAEMDVKQLEKKCRRGKKSDLKKKEFSLDKLKETKPITTSQFTKHKKRRKS